MSGWRSLSRTLGLRRHDTNALRHPELPRHRTDRFRYHQPAGRRGAALCGRRHHRLLRPRSGAVHLGRGSRRDVARLAHADRCGDRCLSALALHAACVRAPPPRPRPAVDPSLQSRADRRHRRACGVVRLQALPAQFDTAHARSRDQSGVALRLCGRRRRADRALRPRDDLQPAAGRRVRALRSFMLLLTVAVIFVALILLSMPIVFALGVAGVAGLWLGGYPMQQLSSALVSGSQSWVLLAIPAFVFAGALMERCGMSHALVELARAMIGWVKGGLGRSVIVVAYFFSDICGSKMAEVSALGSALMPPLTKAGYDRRDSASLIAAGTAMGMLVPPAIFMIVIAQVTNTSAVAMFGAGFIPALVIMLCLMAVVYVRARLLDWRVATKPSLARLGNAALHAAVPMVVPFVILAGFILGIITATEAGAVVAGYAFLAARLYYRNISWREMGRIAYDSAILTAAVVFLLAVASVYQYLMGVSGVPQLLGQVLGPLKAHPWLFLIGTAAMSCLFGMLLEGLPAAVVLIPVVFPITEAMGMDPIHFNIVQTAAVGIGLFLPPMGVGLLMALRFAHLSVAQHFRTYVTYMIALFAGLLLIICIPEISLTLPRLAGLIR